MADRPVQPASAYASPHTPIRASSVLLIGGLALGILGIALLLRRRSREDTVSIVDHSLPHHP